MGEGLKYEDATYYPIFPPTINEDPEERTPYDEVSIDLVLIYYSLTKEDIGKTRL